MSRIDQGNDRDNVLRDDEGTIAEGDQKLQYLSRLTEQLQYRPVRQKIYREYEDHIDDETEYRISTGMTRAEAMKAAVEQMGDPVETGKALDQIHRPERCYFRGWECFLYWDLAWRWFIVFNGICVGSSGHLFLLHYPGEYRLTGSTCFCVLSFLRLCPIFRTPNIRSSVYGQD